MEASRNTWCLELAVILLFAIGNVSQVWARRAPGSGHSDTVSPTTPPAPNSSTIHGYRGIAGTLGVLTAAAFVIPAGIVSIIYLLYVYNCKNSHDNDGDMHLEDSLARSDSEPVDNMVMEFWPVDKVQDEMSTSLSSYAGPGSTDALEKLSLIQGGSDESFTVNDLYVITPKRVKAGNVDDTSVTTVADDARRRDENGNCVMNMVEDHVAGGDFPRRSRAVKAPASGGTECEGIKSNPTNRDDVFETSKNWNRNSGSPTGIFKQAISMNVVNEVHVEVRLTGEGGNSMVPSDTDGGETYTSEVQMYLPGTGAGADESGRTFEPVVNSNKGWF